MNQSDFCTCRDKACPMNPANHQKGCAPCVKKCLAQNEIPSCFFNKVTDDIDSVGSFSFEGFARAVDGRAGQSGGKKIGMLVAVEIESVFGKYGQPANTYDSFGFKVYEYRLESNSLFVVHSGAGEIAAAAATQLLISTYGVEAIINFGVVGGLTDEMKLAKTVVVERVVHYDFDTSAIDNCQVGRYMAYPDIFIPLTPQLVEKAKAIEPGLAGVTCASGDKFVAAPQQKRLLASAFSADICEMELAAIALTCNRCGVPCLAIKTVSDAVEGGADEFLRCLRQSADICLHITERVMAEL